MRLETGECELSHERRKAADLQETLVAESAAKAEAEGVVARLTEELSAAQANASNNSTLAKREVADLKQQMTALGDKAAREMAAAVEERETADRVFATESSRLNGVIASLEHKLSSAQSAHQGDSATWELEKSRLQSTVREAYA